MADPLRQPTASPRNALIRLCQWLRPKLVWFWTAIGLALLLNIVAALLTTKGSDISGTPLGRILAHWPFALAGVALFLILTWVVSYLGRPVTSLARLLPTSRDRRELIRRLRDVYHKQQIQSLQKAAMKSLEGREPAALMLSSASLVSWRMDAPGKPSLAPPTPIVQAYEQVSTGLLILGAPGVGKSTLLLELASGLLTRAEQDKEQPIPVLVNLSSWALNKPPLSTWLEEQLYLMIGIPRRLGHAWIEQNELLLLLDGLDEMEPSARTTCVAAIEAYRERAEHLVRLVVCSRRDEYLAQEGRLRWLDTIEVQPLTPEQVDSYLKGGGKPLAAVRAALRSDAVLRELVTTPLMLSVVMLAYRGKTVKELPQLGTAEDQQRQVFEYYVTRMLESTARKWRYAPRSTRQWLIWLAQQMKQRKFTEFYVERLQPTWLPTEQALNIYIVLNMLVVGLLVGLLVGLFGGGLVLGLLFGLVFGLVFAIVGKIQPSEKLTWSWDSFLQWALFVGWVGGLLVGAYNGLVFGLVFALFGGLLGGLLGGLRSTHVDEHARLRPNQGIRTSGWNALRIGLVSGLDGGLLFWLLGGLRGGLGVELGVGLLFGLVFGLVFGGRTYLQHYCLRFVLYRSGVMPWHYARFLEEATERVLLQRVGGGYRFIHPLFQEHFASLGTGTPANTQSEPSSPKL